MPMFYMMVGLPGSGKSFTAESIPNAVVHSSDAIRAEVLGDENDQTQQDLVFQTLHKRVLQDLVDGKDVVYDATNINYKRRIGFLDRVRALHKHDLRTVCLFMATPYEVCLERNNNRERSVPESVIQKMYFKFDVPMMAEGWDEIRIVGDEDRHDQIDTLMLRLSKLEHDNPHHEYTVGQHSMTAWQYLISHYKGADAALLRATLLHDIGKEKTNPYKKISTTTLAEINKTYKGRWHIYRDDYDNTLDKLIASMTDTVRKYGARCLILDNFMCIDTETSEEELRSQTDTIKKLIEFAKKYQVAVILVCHPRKMDAGTNVGIYDIAGTSNIVNLAHRTIGLRRVTDAERENAAKYSEKRRQLLKYDVIVTIVKDRMFGRQNIDVGLYYDPASRRFFSDMDEYDRRFSWDKKEYKEPLPLPPQLLAEERASEDEAFGAVNDREG